MRDQYTDAQRQKARDWIKALVSGEYPQSTNGVMASIVGVEAQFCVLGVLCAISPEAKPVLKFIESPRGLDIAFDGMRAQPPQSIHTLVAPRHFSLINYAAMNDAGHSFRRIARTIAEDYGLESEFPELFYGRIRTAWTTVTRKLGAIFTLILVLVACGKAPTEPAQCRIKHQAFAVTANDIASDTVWLYRKLCITDTPLNGD